MTEWTIEADGLQKSFGSVAALKGISLRIAKGELFGLIGPDGAGKTTLIRILNTLLLPDQGEARVLGYPLKKGYRKIRRNVGYVPGHSALYNDLSVRENLRFYATIFGSSVQEHYDLIRDIYEPLKPFEDRPAGKLSGGMRQKLALSCALIHRPDLIFLDEPSTGVDPVSRLELWDTISRLKTEGITLLVATPNMDEAARCDRIAFMQEGQILATDSPGGMRDRFDRFLLAVYGQNKMALLRDLRLFPGVEEAYAFGQSIHTSFLRPPDEDRLGAYLQAKGHTQVRLEQAEPTIEDIFIRMNSKQMEAR